MMRPGAPREWEQRDETRQGRAERALGDSGVRVCVCVCYHGKHRTGNNTDCKSHAVHHFVSDCVVIDIFVTFVLYLGVLVGLVRDTRGPEKTGEYLCFLGTRNTQAEASHVELYLFDIDSYSKTHE